MNEIPHKLPDAQKKPSDAASQQPNWDDLRQELFQNKDTGLKKVTDFFNSLKNMFKPKTRFETAEPQPFGQTVRGQVEKTPQPVTQTDKSA